MCVGPREKVKQRAGANGAMRASQRKGEGQGGDGQPSQSPGSVPRSVQARLGKEPCPTVTTQSATLK